MQLRTKFFLSFGFVILMFLSVGIINSIFIVRLDNKVDDVKGERQLFEKKIHECRSLAQQIYGSVLHAALFTTGERTEQVEILDRQAKSFYETVDTIEKFLGDKPDTIEEFRGTFQVYHQYGKQIIKIPDSQLRDKKTELADRFNQHKTVLLAVLNSLFSAHEADLESILEKTREKARIISFGSLGIVILGIFFSFITSMIMSNAFTGTISMIMDTIRAVETGNFDTVTNIKSKNELGKLSIAFSNMTNRLKRSMESLKREVLERKRMEKVTSTLFQISNSVNTTSNLNDLYLSIHRSLGNIIDVTNFYIALYKKENHSVSFPYFIDEMDEDYEYMSLFSSSKSLTGEVIELCKPLLLNKDDLIKRSAENAILGTIPESWLGVPLFIEGTVVGIISTQSYNDSNLYSQKDVDLITSISDQIALAIDRKQKEEELKRLRSLLSNIINSMPSVLIGVDTEGKITQWNLEVIKQTGVVEKDALGKNLPEIYPRLSDQMGKVQKAINERTIQKESKISNKIMGETLFFDVTIYPLFSNGVQGAVIRIDDVTERVQIEEMVIQSEKMLSVGGLAAGMAHEINNPLAGILQNLQVIMNRVRVDFPKNRKTAEECNIEIEHMHDYLDRRGILKMFDAILESGKQAAKIVDNMLFFSRDSKLVSQRCDIVGIVDKTIELASNDYDLKKKYDFRRINIKRDYGEKLPIIKCEPEKIQQVIFNILKNGAHAMWEKTDGTVWDELVEYEKPCFTIRIQHDGKMVTIEIEDNGSGMEEDVRRRIFEPFFTTKMVGIGTGLGLSISYFIITDRHKGTLDVESFPGKGSKFIIKLPLE